MSELRKRPSCPAYRQAGIPLPSWERGRVRGTFRSFGFSSLFGYWCLELGYYHIVIKGSLKVAIFFSSTRPSLVQPLF
jgi:hypothetical protein